MTNGIGSAPIQFTEDEGKFRELILLITQKSDGDASFGSTKLNKLLFAIDLLAYGQTGVPVTGFRYMKGQFGPVPKRLVPVREAMISDHHLVIQPRAIGRRTQQRPVILRNPNVDLFSATEMALIDRVISDFRPANATQISEWSHGLCGWAIAEDGADIPYEVVFLSDLPMTAYEAERGRQLALEKGWDVF